MCKLEFTFPVGIHKLWRGPRSQALHHIDVEGDSTGSMYHNQIRKLFKNGFSKKYKETKAIRRFVYLWKAVNAHPMSRLTHLLNNTFYYLLHMHEVNVEACMRT